MDYFILEIWFPEDKLTLCQTASSFFFYNENNGTTVKDINNAEAITGSRHKLKMKKQSRFGKMK